MSAVISDLSPVLNPKLTSVMDTPQANELIRPAAKKGRARKAAADAEANGKESDQAERHTWNEAEDVLILRQHVLEEGWAVAIALRGKLWDRIAKDVAKEKLLVSGRAVRERIKAVMTKFRRDNPRDEWKTGEAAGQTEKEQLCYEITILMEEAD